MNPSNSTHQPTLLSPLRIVLQREQPLDRFRSAGSGFEEGFDGLSELGEPAVGRVVVRWGGSTVEPVERGGQVEDLTPSFQEVAVENLGDISWGRHDGGISSEGLRRPLYSFVDYAINDSPARGLRDLQARPDVEKKRQGLDFWAVILKRS